MDNERISLRSCNAFGAILLSTLIISACSITHAESENAVFDEANFPPTAIVTEVVFEPDDESLRTQVSTPTPTFTPTFTPTSIPPQIDSTDELVEEESTVQQAKATLEATETPDIKEDSFSQLAYDDLPPFTQWRDWPVLPIVSDTAWQIYQQGLQAGRNPQAVSVFGDCQSVPEVFWGKFDDINYEWADENHELIETVDWYRGSFDRESVTAKDGTTAAAILWEQWIPEDNETCLFGETPLYCEVRINNPSIVFISVGTHWELRNERYLRRMLDQLIEIGILPVIATKADQREGSDGWVNEQMVEIAHEYQVPVWNFWAAMQDFENAGLIEGDTMLLTKEALEERRLSGLRALHTIRLQLLHYQENN